MARSRNTLTSLTPTIACFSGFSLVLTAILFFDATWPIRAGASIATIYVSFSLIYHPFHSIRRDPFSIVVVFKGIIMIGMVFSCLYVSVSGRHESDDGLLLILAITLATLLIADLGTCFFSISNSHYVSRVAHVLEFRVFFVLWIIGWIWRVYALSHGLLYGTLIATRLDLTGASNTLGVLNATAGFAMWGCTVFSSRPLRVLPMVVLEIAWFLVTGSKAALIYILIPFLMIMFQRRILKIDRRFILLLVLLVFSSFLTFAFVRSYRIAAVTQIAATGYENFDALEATKDIDVSLSDLTLIGHSVAERFNYAERMLMILDRDQRVHTPLWYGTSYLTGMLWFIPRAIWHEKPVMSLGRWFAREYLGWGDESRSEAGITIWGEAFLNYGVIGPFILPGLWIVFLQWIYTVALSRGPWGQVFLGAGYVLMANSPAVNLAPSLAGLGQTLVLLVLARGGIGVIHLFDDRLRELSHD